MVILLRDVQHPRRYHSTRALSVFVERALTRSPACDFVSLSPLRARHHGSPRPVVPLCPSVLCTFGRVLGFALRARSGWPVAQPRPGTPPHPHPRHVHCPPNILSTSHSGGRSVSRISLSVIICSWVTPRVLCSTVSSSFLGQGAGDLEVQKPCLPEMSSF